MRRTLSTWGAATLLLAAACSVTTENTTSSPLLAAFQTAPYGMSEVYSTFSLSSDQENLPWAPPGRPGHEFGRGPAGGPMGFIMGGLHGGFMGEGFGTHFGNRPPGEGEGSGNCSFDSGSGRVVCPPITRNGLTILRSAQYRDANGDVQPAFDNQTTNSINTQVSVTGTVTRRDGATSQVDNQSDRTVSGLASGSTQRTVNGTARGHEVTTGTDRTGDFTADRLAGDTVVNVIIPVGTDGHPSFPTSGTITRSMTVTVTYTGSTPVTSTRREVITFTGNNSATITITHDGETRTCTITRGAGRPICS